MYSIDILPQDIARKGLYLPVTSVLFLLPCCRPDLFNDFSFDSFRFLLNSPGPRRKLLPKLSSFNDSWLRNGFNPGTHTPASSK